MSIMSGVVGMILRWNRGEEDLREFAQKMGVDVATAFERLALILHPRFNGDVNAQAAYQSKNNTPAFCFEAPLRWDFFPQNYRTRLSWWRRFLAPIAFGHPMFVVCQPDFSMHSEFSLGQTIPHADQRCPTRSCHFIAVALKRGVS